MSEQTTESIMKKITVSKVVLNMGVGKSGEAIETAKKALDYISGKKSCATHAKESQRDFGVRKGEPIGATVTVRGKDAVKLLKLLLEAKGNTLRSRSFDDFGNFSFGIKEHIDIPGIKYDPHIGILGLDVAISLTRPGYGIRVRSRHKAKVGKDHRITAKEAQGFISKDFGAEMV